MVVRAKLVASNLLKTGFFHIVGSSVVNKAVQTFLSVVLVRVMSKGAYGAYAYAFNILSFFVLFNALGMPSAILQVCSELYDEPDKAASTFRYGMCFGVAFDIVMALAILAVSGLAPLALPASERILALYASLPLAQFLCEGTLTWLRVELRNREYSLMTNLQTMLVAVASVIGAWTRGAEGLAVGQSLGYLLSFVLIVLLCRMGFAVTTARLEGRDRLDMIRIGGISAFNNGISQALTLVGTFIIGVLVADEEMVASYKVATTIPFALVFVPLMLITYVTPFFTRHRFDRSWTLRHYSLVIGTLSLCMGAGCLILAIFAEPIVMTLFGESYMDCVSTLRLLLAGSFVTTSFRVPTGNLLVTQRRLLVNTFVGATSITINVVVSFVLIPRAGVLGAALAYDITMLYGAIVSVFCYLRTLFGIGKGGELPWKEGEGLSS